MQIMLKLYFPSSKNAKNNLDISKEHMLLLLQTVHIAIFQLQPDNSKARLFDFFYICNLSLCEPRSWILECTHLQVKMTHQASTQSNQAESNPWSRDAICILSTRTLSVEGVVRSEWKRIYLSYHNYNWIITFFKSSTLDSSQNNKRFYR